jgi:hypothetical protein
MLASSHRRGEWSPPRKDDNLDIGQDTGKKKSKKSKRRKRRQ